MKFSRILQLFLLIVLAVNSVHGMDHQQLEGRDEKGEIVPGNQPQQVAVAQLLAEIEGAASYKDDGKDSKAAFKPTAQVAQFCKDQKKLLEIVLKLSDNTLGVHCVTCDSKREYELAVKACNVWYSLQMSGELVVCFYNANDEKANGMYGASFGYRFKSDGITAIFVPSPSFEKEGMSQSNRMKQSLFAAVRALGFASFYESVHGVESAVQVTKTQTVLGVATLAVCGYLMYTFGGNYGSKIFGNECPSNQLFQGLIVCPAADAVGVGIGTLLSGNIFTRVINKIGNIVAPRYFVDKYAEDTYYHEASKQQRRIIAALLKDKDGKQQAARSTMFRRMQIHAEAFAIDLLVKLREYDLIAAGIVDILTNKEDTHALYLVAQETQMIKIITKLMQKNIRLSDLIQDQALKKQFDELYEQFNQDYIKAHAELL